LLKNKTRRQEKKMKTLRHLCATLALTFVLAFPALAGQMDTGIAVPPPPPQGNISTTVAGNMEEGWSKQRAVLISI
jgi:hypothetical protein